MKINLDTLGSKKPVDYKTPAEGTTGPTSLNSSEMGLVLSSTAVKPPPASNSVAEMYHKLKRLIYLVDVSDSTADIMAGVDAIEMYEWRSDWEAQVKIHIDDAAKKVTEYEDAIAAATSGDDDDDPDGIPSSPDVVGIVPVSPMLSALAQLAGLEGDELKGQLVATGLAKNYIPRNYGKVDNELTKLGLMKKMTKRVVTERLDKMPDSDVVCATFNHSVQFLPGNTKESLIKNVAAIERGGGTNICFAMQTMIDFVRASPARVKMNHIVLVTDGEDYFAKNLPDLIPALVEVGIVLDFIYVMQPFDHSTREIAAKIKEVCDATGGQYKEVQSAAEFETVFLDRANRLCLPPSSVK